MAIHDFDIARWLLGEPVVEVFAAAACLIDPAIGAADDIDTAKMLLRTARGRLCLISNSRRSGYGYDQRIEAFGSGGMVARRQRRWRARSRSGPRRAPAARRSRISSSTATPRLTALEMDAFRRPCCAARSRPSASPTALAALELAEAAGESARTGAPVKL